MSLNRSLFSSETDQWATPQALFNTLDALFHFDLDVAATDENAKCGRYFTVAENGLKQPWIGTCWMNPPYGRKIIDLWVKKASESALEGATVVALVPARTDTQWWQNYCAGQEVFFLMGRLKFGDATSGAPFPSALVIFRPRISPNLLKGYS